MPVTPARAADDRPLAPAVRLEGVEFGYADAPGVLKDVNLTLPAGSFHFLTGPSGAGKSSLLKLLTLVEKPHHGRLVLFGEDVTDLPRRAAPLMRRRIGTVFQDFRLLDHLSAFDNAALPLRLARVKPADYAPDVEEMLHWVGLGDRMHSLPPALSGGEKQRLAIARAVGGQPDLIGADQPTGRVEKSRAQRPRRLLPSPNRLGTTILIASHDEALAKRSGARVLHLSNGRLTGGVA